MTVNSGTQSGAVTLIQRFGSALNLNLHFHMLYLNGVYDNTGCFWPGQPLTPEDLEAIAHKIAKRVSRYLDRAGYLYRDAETEYLDLIPDEDDAMSGIIGASITYRLAFGPHAGKKVLTLLRKYRSIWGWMRPHRPGIAHRQKDCSRIRPNYSDICQR